MFSISHGPEGSFRLEIHSAPADLDPADAHRLRAVLLGLARQVEPGRGGGDDGHGRSGASGRAAERAAADRGDLLADVG